MARYFVRPADREHMPEGRDWYFIEDPNGDAHFVVCREADSVEILPEVLTNLLGKVVDAYERSTHSAA